VGRGKAKCPKSYSLPVWPHYAHFIYGYPQFNEKTKKLQRPKGQYDSCYNTLILLPHFLKHKNHPQLESRY
jgi:hypothetical protein